MLGYVLADDLTGACDVGVQFTEQGLKTVVSVSTSRVVGVESSIDVLVVNSDSRSTSPEIAYKRVREIAGGMKDRGVRLLYKKIDSTLKGNLGVELEAILDTLPVPFILVCPAFPENRRTLVDGRLRLEYGSQASTTEASVIGEVNLIELLEQQRKRKVGYVGLSCVEGGEDCLVKTFERLLKEGYKIIVGDAAERSHLDNLARAVVPLGGLLSGSAGLAGSYARHLPPKMTRVLIVSGSVNPVTLGQIAYLQKKNRTRVLNGRASKSAVSRLSLDDEESREIPIYILASALQPQDVDRSEPGEYFTRRLGELSLMLCRNLKPDLLIMIGGETSIAVLERLKAEGFELLEEVEPGIPLARLIGGGFQGLYTLTKAGGFGDEKTLHRLIRYLS